MLLFAVFIVTVLTAQPVFNGTWLLDLAASDSSYGMLTAMGMSSYRAYIASRLVVRETYRVTARTFYNHRETAYTNTEATYLFGVESTVTDMILGEGVNMVQFKDNHLVYTFRRTADFAFFQSKRVLDSSNRLHNVMNYSSPVARGSFIQYYNRQ